jgi:aryl-alcohol dehydrogenase-like predicted oxidoreductase
MKYRPLGRTGFLVSEVSFGAWAVGGTWGHVDDETSLRAMHRAVDLGVNFFDTADVYGDGRSERLIQRLKSERSEEIVVATKAGRRLNPHTADGYEIKNLTEFIDRSLANLGTEALDLVQLHCPPTEVYYRPEVFEALDALVKKGKIRHYGVSIERIEEGLKAINFPGVETIQVIFNIFRQRPIADLFPMTEAKNVGILARLPLSSGMLSGKLRKDTSFEADDHRSFNRDGAAFDKGETFSGLDYDLGLEVVEVIRPLVPAGESMAQFALKWILAHPAVSCAIPGAKTPEQADSNFGVSELPDLSQETQEQIRRIYENRVKSSVHERW